MKLLKWLSPGMFVKRWMLVAVTGLVLFSFGIIFVTMAVSTPELQLPLSFGIALLVLGFLLIGFGIKNWLRSIISAVLPQEEGRLVEILDRRRLHKKGLRIVTIGGGSGLSSLLRGLKEISGNIVAVVTVSDDGGSSGILRRELGVLPPGDIRNCLVALADTEPLLCELFQYRFSDSGTLCGHSFGNLYLAAMTHVTGNFLTAVQESSKVLAIRGKVLPATLESAVLCAVLSDGSIVEGESKVGKSTLPIKRLFFKPAVPNALEEACKAIRGADAVIFGPGSLFTSIIPNLLVNGIMESIKASKGVKIYICNIMTQPGETGTLSASGHLTALEQYLGTGVLDYMVVNEEIPEEKLLGRYREDGAALVEPDIEEIEKMGVKSITGQFLIGKELIRHDPVKLAKVINDLIISGMPELSPQGHAAGQHLSGRREFSRLSNG